jgi:glutathione S-transferase
MPSSSSSFQETGDPNATHHEKKKQKLEGHPQEDDPTTTPQKTVAAALFEGDELWSEDWKESYGEQTLRDRISTERPKFVLYGSWFCPFAQRAWIVAELCGVDYKIQEINPFEVDADRPGGYTNKSLPLETKRELYPDFVAASPRGLVPALRVPSKGEKDIVLWESLPIAEYIDAVFGNGTLMPRNDPLKVAQQQIWIQHCSDRINRNYYQALVAQSTEIQKQCVEEFYNECRMFANAMSTEGPYFDGRHLTMLILHWYRSGNVSQRSDRTISI